MGKVISILIGLILTALGVVGIIAWKEEVVAFLQAAIVLMAIVVGLGVFVFGLSELRAGTEELPAVEPLPTADQDTSETSEPKESDS